MARQDAGTTIVINTLYVARTVLYITRATPRLFTISAIEYANNIDARRRSRYRVVKNSVTVVVNKCKPYGRWNVDGFFLTCVERRRKSDDTLNM